MAEALRVVRSETNPKKFRKLVFELEDAIVIRYHDLACEPDAPSGTKGTIGSTVSDELQTLSRAAERLVQLKIDKLAWPQPATAVASAMPDLMPVSVPESANDVEQDGHLPRPLSVQIAWQTVVKRTQAVLLVMQRAWQNWVFKSLK